ncbi:MAG: right-handed parallel beta-helix repeat-containing protein [Betaproteobacteria bacterium]|nr:right-handed parallel beta-helix repeat-containing protein [Betaproteobacteria bacterium]
MTKLLCSAFRELSSTVLLLLVAVALPGMSQAQSAPLADIQALAAGHHHTCALTTGGGVKCWGNNSSGQLGDNSTTQRLTPVDVAGLSSGVSAIAAGSFHACALTSGGGVKCWGSNGYGQLGDNTTTQRLAPVDVSGLTSGVSAISAGGSHTCALTSGGGVKCWGQNAYGQLGDNSTTGQLAPVDVSGLASGVSAVAAGDPHTCALTSGGGVKCWGGNAAGQLGDNSTTQRLTPVDVLGLASGVGAIVAGYSHTCALTTGGGVQCWGDNTHGQMGDNGTLRRLIPSGVYGLTSAVAMLAAGGKHSCALAGGAAKCWGRNIFGQLGDNSTTDRLTPVDVSGLTTGVNVIAAGSHHTCAVTSGGEVKCWGRNAYGQLGDNSTTQRLMPVDVIGLASGVASIGAGAEHTCALISGGGVKCWGYNASGQLGDNSSTGRLVPVYVWGLTSGITAIAAGGEHSCALTSAGGVKCWGDNYYGQLGDNSTVAHLTPVDVSGLTSGVAGIAAGSSHTCALTAGGGVKCWGANSYGQLGDNSLNQRKTPVDVSGLATGVAAIAAGENHTCALTTSGGLKCWGYNNGGQLGDNSTTQRLAPVDVSGLTSGVGAVAAGGDHTCALTTSGGVKCWGSNGYGQLGDGTAGVRSFPGDVLILVPAAPSGVSASATNASAVVYFVPEWNGGAPIDNFRVTCNPGNHTNTGSSSPITIAGLTNGIAYTCTVSAHNSVGWSLESAPSNAFFSGVQRVFVSASSGSDANVASNCSLALPCASLAAAMGVVASGGEIIALDTGEFGPVTIDRSVAIIGAAGVRPALTAGSGHAVTIAAPGLKVSMRQLHLVGTGGSTGVHLVQSSGTLEMINCTVSGFTDYGIDARGGVSVQVLGSTVRQSATGVALHNGVNALITQSRFEGHSDGAIVLVGDVAGLTKASVVASQITGHPLGLGMAAQSLVSSAVVQLAITRSTVTQSAIGVLAESSTGGGAWVTVSRSRISDSVLGFLQSGSGAALRSTGNNTLSGNVSNAAGTITPQAGM